jgi:acetyl-CoA carboxylase carboxyl transferase subunit alpha
MLDLIAGRDQQRDMLVSILTLLDKNTSKTKLKKPKKVKRREPKKGRIQAWEAVQAARDPARPTAKEYIKGMFDTFVELRGDRLSRDDPSVVCGLASLEGTPVLVLAQERPKDTDTSHFLMPEGLRKAQRALGLASKFGLPLVTLIDTPGASPSPEAEERGIGYALANSMARMAIHPAPSVAAVIGVGGREGALAFGIADRILMMEHAIYSPISPEEAADLFYGHTEKAADLAQSLRLTSWDCKELGIIDELVPEPLGDIQKAAEAAPSLLKEYVITALVELGRYSPQKLLIGREKKFRRMGEYSSYVRAVLSRKMALRKERKAAKKKVKRELQRAGSRRCPWGCPALGKEEAPPQKGRVKRTK